ncbi:hypothetical protein [Marinobacter sp. NFXS9]|uniref:hypothetical protein n=1 Tax=Marinobacter sp. NFXS9 TaxID=2818433 RepID=UPI0032DE6D48
MKISDIELIQAIWKNQIRLLSGSVVMRYVGGMYGVCRNDDFWYVSNSSEHRCSRQNITRVLGEQQLWSRIKRLYQEGHLSSKYHGELLTFFIDGELAREAFSAARNWWLARGIPQGMENGASRCVPLSENQYQAMQKDCFADLMDMFPSPPEKTKTCTYPSCNCPFDMGADSKCLRNRPSKPEGGR